MHQKKNNRILNNYLILISDNYIIFKPKKHIIPSNNDAVVIVTTVFYFLWIILLLFQKLMSNLNKQHPSLEMLIQVTDDTKWQNKLHVANDTAVLHKNFSDVSLDVEQKSSMLKTLYAKINTMEDMIEDIAMQLHTVNESLVECMELVCEGDVEKASRNVKVKGAS